MILAHCLLTLVGLVSAAVTCTAILHGIVNLIFKRTAIKHKLAAYRAEAKLYQLQPRSTRRSYFYHRFCIHSSVCCDWLFSCYYFTDQHDQSQLYFV